MYVYVCVGVCMDDMKETGVGGRPQGHHHVNGDALAGHGLCHLLIRPNLLLEEVIRPSIPIPVELRGMGF